MVSSESDTSPNSVLGTRTGLELTPPPDKDLVVQGKKPDKFFQILLILAGLVFIGACVMWTMKIIKKGDLPQNEEQ